MPDVVDWTAHGYKHSPQKNMPWKDVINSTKSGPAKYKPEINIEALEREAYRNGIPTNNQKPWKVKKYNNTIGASDGKQSPWIRVELSANTIHGHPISEIDFRKLTK